MSTTELFNRDGKLFVILTETNDGRIVTQEWRYADDAAPYAGASTGCTEVSVHLAHPERCADDDIEALVSAWQSAVTKPGFRSAHNGGEVGARAFLAQTKGYGTLHATNRAA